MLKDLETVLIVGLGNPGKQYEFTRHNLGFIALDYTLGKLGLSWSSKPKFNAMIADKTMNPGKVFLCKPLTYMNLSGQTVSSVISYYKIKPDNVFVIYDDIDLPVGSIRYKFAGGSAGHNGIKSIDQQIGPLYHRIRVGIGRPANKDMPVSSYVLEPFSQEEYKKIESSIEKIYNNITLLLSGEVEKFKLEVTSSL